MSPGSRQVLRTCQYFPLDRIHLEDDVCTDVGRRSRVKGRGCSQVAVSSLGPLPPPAALRAEGAVPWHTYNFWQPAWEALG